MGHAPFEAQSLILCLVFPLLAKKMQKEKEITFYDGTVCSFIH